MYWNVASEEGSEVFTPKSCKDPVSIIVRDRRTGMPVRLSTCIIPDALRPDNWYENACWQYSRALTREEVGKFLQDQKSEIPYVLARKLAQYIYDYAANIAVAAWIFSDDRDKYYEYMLPCLQKLRQLKPKAKTKQDVLDMLHVAMEYAVDPF